MMTASLGMSASFTEAIFNICRSIKRWRQPILGLLMSPLGMALRLRQLRYCETAHVLVASERSCRVLCSAGPLIAEADQR